MASYDYRILIETFNGKQFSYISQSFFNTAIDTNYAVSSSDVWERITGSVSCSFQNSTFFSQSLTIQDDQLYTASIFKDNIFISSSTTGPNTGSISFNFTQVTGSDKLKRFKIIGEKGPRFSRSR